MSNFIEDIFGRLKLAGSRVVLREIRGGNFVSVSGGELLEQVRRARVYLRRAGIPPGERCALLGPNSIRWVALNLGLLAEGIVVVPLYARQAPAELAGLMKDALPQLLFASDAALGESVAKELPPQWAGAKRLVLFDEVFQESPGEPGIFDPPKARQDSDLVTIIYTSGTSGEPKGVCLNVGNVTHLLSCTCERLDWLMGAAREPDRVFHYGPFSFAASWIMLLTCLSRESVLTLSTDLTKLPDEIRLSGPHYFLNVPTLLERVRRGVEEAIAKRAAPIRSLYAKASRAWLRKQSGRIGLLDAIWLGLGRRLLFGAIRKRFGPNLRALICGSAPLSPETHQFFLMLGIPVLQAYGLTETTAICTLDDPRVPVEPGHVGTAIRGIEMKTGDNGEILVRGPNIFPGYWKRSEETARVIQDGWFHTGDQGETNERGNWRITGRIKNLIVLNSGHKIPPEPIEEKLARLLPTAQQVVIVGNGHGFLCALLTGELEPTAVRSALDALNPELPHYRQIRNFTILAQPMTAESGLLTVMGKLRRDAINTHFAAEISAMYAEALESKAAAGNRS
ncbi:MAG TPA: AMP-binding protein [Candidatus Acidoferrum sp.]|nr:AMP-binding protein [Candidatus Acidoferrum sp.]